MFFERYFVEGLAHASYFFGADGEAAVVDPQRDVQGYLEAAERHGARIVAIFETHPHADFASGHVELAQRTGATIYISEKAPATYEHRDLRHHDEVPVGSLQVVALDTPGHSPDSMSFYLDAGDERVVFTGDTLFVWDVGRPDLRDADADPRGLAGELYDSLHQVLYQLPEDTVVYPAHGAGSLCGRKIGSAPSSTISTEKTVNWANQFETREAFIEAMVSNLPERPAYFSYDVAVNLRGARPLSEVPRPGRLDPGSLLREHADAQLIDTRSAEEYGAAHVEGSLNIGGAIPVFSTWVGFFVDPGRPAILVAHGPEDVDRAWLELARIGFENLAGWIAADPAAWRAAGLPVRRTPQIDVEALQEWLAAGKAVLDVRTPGEWRDGHLDAATWISLAGLPWRLDEVPAGPLAVLCGSGFRSSLAAGILERAGRHDVVNVEGGWTAWSRQSLVEPDASDVFAPEPAHA